MDKKQPSPELSQVELPPDQEEQVPSSPLSRKRQLDSDDDAGAEPRTKRARTTRPTSRLTRQNLARFNKMGKKKSSDPSDDSGSTRTKTTSTTTTGFADKARNNGILPPLYSKPPKNLEDIQRRHTKSRATTSPPESIYEDYTSRVGKAGNEATMVYEVGRKLLKEYDDKGYRQAFNRAFTNLPKNAGFNKGLSAPQPDFIEGLEKEEFRPFPVADHVPGAALYDDDPYSITLPQLAGEWKGPDGSMREAELQAAYDGAALVHARHQALSYMGRSDPPGHAEITTFTTDGKSINFFAHYATESEEDGTLEYHQYTIRSTSLVNSHKEHKEGRRGLRNTQDRAREQSYALRDQLKEYYKQQRVGGLHPTAEEVPPLPVPGIEPLDVYKDVYEDEGEGEGDHNVVEHQPVYQPTPPTPSEPKHSKSHHSHSTSKSPSSTHSPTHNSGSKRKAPSSQSFHESSEHISKYRSC